MKKTIDEIYHLLIQSDLSNNQLKPYLKKELTEIGIKRFIQEIAEPLGVKVGEKWDNKEITLFIEHFYSSQMNAILNEFVLQNESICKHDNPKILLCTTVGEKHLLGCTLINALLSQQGAFCINLGSELPIVEIIRAVNYYQPNILGLSFSSFFNKRLMIAVVNQIREKMPSNVELWIGGKGAENTNIHSAKVLISVDEILKSYSNILKDSLVNNSK